MTSAFLEITLKIAHENRFNAGEIFAKYKYAFLSGVSGALTKDLLLRSEDVQVLHGFDTRESAENYLSTPLFKESVVPELKPFLTAAPEIRIYERA